jgi:hypothetical protein
MGWRAMLSLTREIGYVLNAAEELRKISKG